MSVQTTRCSSPLCRKQVYWSRDAKTGRAVPLDPDPVANGNIRLNPNGTCSYLSKAERQEYAGAAYVSHFATCVDRDRFRRKR